MLPLTYPYPFALPRSPSYSCPSQSHSFSQPHLLASALSLATSYVECRGFRDRATESRPKKQKQNPDSNPMLLFEILGIFSLYIASVHSAVHSGYRKWWIFVHSHRQPSRINCSVAGCLPNSDMLSLPLYAAASRFSHPSPALPFMIRPPVSNLLTSHYALFINKYIRGLHRCGSAPKSLLYFTFSQPKSVTLTGILIGRSNHVDRHGASEAKSVFKTGSSFYFEEEEICLKVFPSVGRRSALDQKK